MRLRTILAMLLLPYAAIAGGSFVIELTGAATVATATQKCEGYIESIHIDVTGVTTGAVNIATGDEVVYTNTTVTADANLRPRVVTHDSTGATLSGGTSTWDRIYMDNEDLTVTLLDTAPAGAVYRIKVKMVKQLP